MYFVSYHYVIDGYNLLYAMAELPAGSWQQKRESFLEFLNERRPQGNNHLTVVFDNRDGMGDHIQQKEQRIVFTSGETADEWISQFVRNTSNPRELVVVSNDRGIQALVRGTGARFLTANKFLSQTRARDLRRTDREPGRNLDHDKITEEFKKKWLKDGST